MQKVLTTLFRVVLAVAMWITGRLWKPTVTRAAKLSPNRPRKLPRLPRRYAAAIRATRTAALFAMFAGTVWTGARISAPTLAAPVPAWALVSSEADAQNVLVKTLDYSTAANTAAGTAGSTTGASLPGILVTDVTGGVGNISSGALQVTSDAGGTYPQRMQLLLPVGDSFLPERIVGVTQIGGSGSPTWGMHVRYQASNISAYAVLDSANSTFGVYAQSTGLAGPFAGNSGALTTTFNSAHQYKLDFSINGTSPPVIALTITDLNTMGVVANVSGNWTLNINAAATTAGRFAVSANRASSVSRWASITTYQGSTMATAANAVAVSPTSVTVAATVTNGTGPFTYQWYRSTIAGFTPGGGNLLAGATAATLTDTGLTPQVGYKYRCIATDSLSNTATSLELPMMTQPASASTIVLCKIGDSTSQVSNGSINTQRSADYMIYLLSAYPGLTVAGYTNQAVPGTTTTDWLFGSANAQATINAACAIGANYYSCMLGTNNSKTGIRTSASQYRADLINIAAWVNSTGSKIVFDSPPWIDLTQAVAAASWDSTSLALLTAYGLQIATVVNNTSIFQGDTTIYALVQTTPSYLLAGDGVHQSALTGIPLYGRALGNGICTVYIPHYNNTYSNN